MAADRISCSRWDFLRGTAAAVGAGGLSLLPSTALAQGVQRTAWGIEILAEGSSLHIPKLVLSDYTYLYCADSVRSIDWHIDELQLGKMCILDLSRSLKTFALFPNSQPQGKLLRSDVPPDAKVLLWPAQEHAVTHSFMNPEVSGYAPQPPLGAGWAGGRSPGFYAPVFLVTWDEYWYFSQFGEWPKVDTYLRSLRPNLNPQTFSQATLGEPGNVGTPGAYGAQGKSGVWFSLTVGKVSSKGSLWILTDGSPGGPGTGGGDGQTGGGVSCGQGIGTMAAGGRGGDGGPGGNGGYGGDTARVQIMSTQASTKTVDASCGSPGVFTFEWEDPSHYIGYRLKPFDSWPSPMPAELTRDDGTIVIYGTPGPGGPGGPGGRPGGGTPDKSCDLFGLGALPGGPPGVAGSDGHSQPGGHCMCNGANASVTCPPWGYKR